MCEHGKLKTVADRLFCKLCGAELPMEFLTGGTGDTVEPQKEPEKPAQAKRTGKPAGRKPAAKKGEKGGKNA